MPDKDKLGWYFRPSQMLYEFYLPAPLGPVTDGGEQKPLKSMTAEFLSLARDNAPELWAEVTAMSEVRPHLA